MQYKYTCFWIHKMFEKTEQFENVFIQHTLLVYKLYLHYRSTVAYSFIWQTSLKLYIINAQQCLYVINISLHTEVLNLRFCILNRIYLISLKLYLFFHQQLLKVHHTYTYILHEVVYNIWSYCSHFGSWTNAVQNWGRTEENKNI